jgi:hypothetical protein
MSWKLPRIHGTDQGKPFDRMTPEQKATEFDASHEDPAAYAERNFTGQTPTKEQQYEAARAEQKTQQKGRHRK